MVSNTESDLGEYLWDTKEMCTYIEDMPVEV